MRTYPDSSFILRLVTGEAESPHAIALTLDTELFLTTDSRQAQLASAEGLKVVSSD